MTARPFYASTPTLAPILPVMAAGIVLLAMGGGSSTVAALELSVRGEAQLDVEVQPAATTVKVAGRLYDDIGESLVQRRVDVSLRSGDQVVFEQRIHTDFNGQFNTLTEVAPGDYTVEVSYPGEQHMESVEATETVTVDAKAVELDVGAPRWIHGRDGAVPVDIRATADGRGLPGFASVAVDEGARASVELDWQGAGRFDVGPHLEDGFNTVDVEIPSTEHRHAQATSIPIRRVVDPTVEGRVDRVFRRARRGVRVELEIADAHGPLRGATTDLSLRRTGPDQGTGEANPELLRRSEVTDDGGRVSVFFADGELRDGTWLISATISAPVGPSIEWEGESVKQRESRLVNLARMMALLAALAAFFWLGRSWITSAIAVLADRFGGSSKEEPAAEVFAAVEKTSLDSMSTVAVEHGGEASRLQLWDSWRDRPVEKGRLEVYGADGEVLEKFDGVDGAVELSANPEEIAALEASAFGFVPARVEFSGGPPAGAMRLSMTPVPLKIRAAYRWMVERARGEDPWGELTPRQIEDALRELDDNGEDNESRVGRLDSWRELLARWDEADSERRGRLLVGVITELVEETNYSGRDYDVDVWESARVAMKALAARLEATGEDA